MEFRSDGLSDGLVIMSAVATSWQAASGRMFKKRPKKFKGFYRSENTVPGVPQACILLFYG